MKMSSEAALLYNFQDPQRLRTIKSVLLCMGIKVKIVDPKDYGKPLGALVGLDGFSSGEKPENDQSFSDEMMVLHQFSGKRVDDLLRRLGKVGVGNIPYKAIVTKSNISWSGIALHEELVKEHEAMLQGKSAHETDPKEE